MGIGQVTFDDYFQGADDNARIRSMNQWANTHGGKPTAEVVFDAREYRISEPIGLTSGLRIIGGAGSAVREFGRQTIIRYVGTGALFRFGVQQTNQSYPSDNSPRDINVTGIEFRGGAASDFIEPHPPGTPYRGFVLWLSNFHNCGWNGWKSIYWGAGDGITFDGVTHCQAFSDTAFWIGGSECCLFGQDAYSFMDSQAPGIFGKSMIRLSMGKSSLGQVMVTTRKNILALLVDGGNGLRCLGFTADSQDSDPACGANIRVTGSTRNLLIGDGTLKGNMADPANGPGGAALNRAPIHVDSTGGDIIIDRAVYVRSGARAAPPEMPLVYAGPNVPPQGVRLGLTAHSGYTGIVVGSKAGQIVSTDPTLSIRSG